MNSLEPYSIIIPTEKSFKDRIIKTNPLFGDPLSWFDNSLLETQNLNKIQFDYFINWRNKTLQHEVWLKRLYKVHTSEKQTREAFAPNILIQKISACDSPYFNTQNSINFLCSNGFSPKYMIIKDLNHPDEFKVNNQEIRNTVVTVLPVSINGIGNPQHLNLESLKDNIRTLSGGPLDNDKQLYISTSALESHLYSTPDKWPGDCDLLLFDNNYNCKAIIEFKKHNISTQNLNNHSIEPWLHGKDSRKYKRLGILRDYFASRQGTMVPLVVFIYPTYENENRIKLEFLEGAWDKLEIKKQIILAGPITEENKINIINTILTGGHNDY